MRVLDFFMLFSMVKVPDLTRFRLINICTSQQLYKGFTFNVPILYILVPFSVCVSTLCTNTYKSGWHYLWMSHCQCALMLMISLCLVSKRCYKAELTCCASLSMMSLHHNTTLLLRPPTNALFPTPDLIRHQATIPHQIRLMEIQEGYLHNLILDSILHKGGLDV